MGRRQKPCPLALRYAGLPWRLQLVFTRTQRALSEFFGSAGPFLRFNSLRLPHLTYQLHALALFRDHCGYDDVLLDPALLDGVALPWAQLVAFVRLKYDPEQTACVVKLYKLANPDAPLAAGTAAPELRLPANTYKALPLAALHQRIALYPSQKLRPQTFYLDWWQSHGDTAYPDHSRVSFLARWRPEAPQSFLIPNEEPG